MLSIARRNLSAPVSLPLLFFLVFFAAFDGCSAAFGFKKHPKTQKFGSSVVFPVTGNVYPTGYYHVTVNIGEPPKPYFLDIDTGSDLTWLQCDAPCRRCIPAPHGLYKPNKNIVMCKDPLCASLYGTGNHPCGPPDEQCHYEVEYADHGSSMGVLIRDVFPLKFTNGSFIGSRLAFGCGYDQEVAASTHPPYTDGVLGLGIGKSSIVAQLRDLGLVRNVVGHCLSGHGGGFMFFGDDLVPSAGIVWTPILSTSDKHYSLGLADFLFGGQATAVKGLSVVFDSGSTYSYFSSQAYNTLVSMVKKNINVKELQDATDDKSLPICWKGSKSFKSVSDVKNLFKPLALRFTNAKGVELELPPEAYLVVTEHGNVCLGILNGNEVGLENFNVIGDISLHDKMVIYDNEKRQVGWGSANCDKVPYS